MLIYWDKEVRDVVNFFDLNLRSTILAFRLAKTDAIAVEYDEFLKIISTFPISTAECDRGFSELKDIFT